MKNTDSKIDIVVTYVKEDAPGFVEERQKWQAKSECANGSGQNSGCRWRNWNFFNYWFRCVEKNVPWVNKIFLVLKDKTHIPEWLNVDNPKLRIVYHDEYIPALFLPTFNVHTIEMFFANIPDLSEYYITCNDDCFFFNYIDKESFIRDNKAVRDLRKCVYSHNCHNDWNETVNNGHRLLSKMFFGGKSEYPPYLFVYTHLPELRNKYLEILLLQRYLPELYATLGDGKFRNRKNCAISWVFIDALKYDAHFPKVHDTTVYSKSKWLTIKSNLASLDDIWQKCIVDKCQMVCINDSQALTDNFFLTAKDFITGKLMPTAFPERCSFEKPLSVSVSAKANDNVDALLKSIGKTMLSKFDMIVIKSTFGNSACNTTFKTLEKLDLFTGSNIANRKVVILYDLPSMVRRLLYTKLRASKMATNIIRFYIMLNYYHAISDAYYANAKYALMFEDDLVINKNLSLVQLMLDNMPKDYGFINFLPSPLLGEKAVQQFKECVSVYHNEGKLFFNTSNMLLVSAGCIAMSRDYMKACINICESIIAGKRKSEHVDVMLQSPWAMPPSIKANMYSATQPMFMQLMHAHLHCSPGIYNHYLKAFDLTKDDFLNVE